MAFNIMDLFGPGALNRLLQPAQQQGVQNFLANPAAVQQQQAAPPLPSGQEVASLPVAGVPLDTAQQVDPWLGMREQDVVRPDQMQTASTGQRPAGSVVVPDKPGGWDKYTKDIFRENLNQFFVGMAQGRTPAESLSMGAMAANAKHNDMKNANQTVAWLQSKGMDKEQAWALAQSPPALNEYLKTLAAGNDPMKALQLQKTQLEIQNLQDPNSRLSESERRYKQAVEEGFKGSRMDYDVKMKEAGRNQVNIDTGAKLPSGFRWKDPANQELGVEPIPGGPGEQIPGELAARVGMSESFAGQAPALRERLQSGEMTGPIDSLMGQFGMGARGETYRQLQSGTDALMRLLTGAGMNESEARAYAERYLPTMKDTPDSAVGKLDQLMRELEAAKGMAMRGRGGAQPDQTADPLGLR